MNVGDYLEKWGRTLFETPLATVSRTGEPPELAEVRLAVLDRVREKSYRSGGRKVFPYDLLRVEMRGVEDERRDVFGGRFFRQYIEQEVRAALRDAGCRFPGNLRVDVASRGGDAQARRRLAQRGGRVAGGRCRARACRQAHRARRRCQHP